MLSLVNILLGALKFRIQELYGIIILLQNHFTDVFFPYRAFLLLSFCGLFDLLRLRF